MTLACLPARRSNVEQEDLAGSSNDEEDRKRLKKRLKVRGRSCGPSPGGLACAAARWLTAAQELVREMRTQYLRISVLSKVKSPCRRALFFCCRLAPF